MNKRNVNATVIIGSGIYLTSLEKRRREGRREECKLTYRHAKTFLPNTLSQGEEREEKEQ